MLSFVRIVYKSRTGNEVPKYLMYLNAKFVFKIELMLCQLSKKITQKGGSKTENKQTRSF